MCCRRRLQGVPAEVYCNIAATASATAVRGAGVSQALAAGIIRRREKASKEATMKKELKRARGASAADNMYACIVCPLCKDATAP